MVLVFRLLRWRWRWPAVGARGLSAMRAPPAMLGACLEHCLKHSTGVLAGCAVAWPACWARSRTRRAARPSIRPDGRHRAGAGIRLRHVAPVLLQGVQFQRPIGGWAWGGLLRT